MSNDITDVLSWDEFLKHIRKNKLQKSIYVKKG